MSLVLFTRVATRSVVLRHTPLAVGCAVPPLPPLRLKVASYNAQSLGLGGHKTDAVVRLLSSLDADVIAIQEVLDRGGKTIEGLARRTGHAHCAFGATIQKRGIDYGLGLLSRWPLRALTRVELLHNLAYEPRLALDATVCVGAGPVRVLSMHGDVFRDSSRANVLELTNHLLETADGAPRLLLGDLNLRPESTALAPLREAGLIDLLAEDGRPPSPTFPARKPRHRIDYIWADMGLRERLQRVEVVPTVVTDHLAVAATFDVQGIGATPA